MSQRLETLIRNFEEAAVVKAFKGCRDPETWDEIDRKYDIRKRELVYAVTMLRVACNEVIGSSDKVPDDASLMVVKISTLEEMAKRMNNVNG